MGETKGPKSWRSCEIVNQLEYMPQDVVEAGLDHNAVKDYAYIPVSYTHLTLPTT